MAIKFEFNLTLASAEAMRDALTTVLEEADIHVDEAEHLEVLRDAFEYKIEKAKDYATDLELI
jgi:hypothetical protein